MGNTVEKMRERELVRRQTKRDELVAFLEGSKRRRSLLDVSGNPIGDEAQNSQLVDGDRPMAFARGAAALDTDDDHRLTDREREAWLYRMENEALEVMNDNMELQEERRRERERREERREELENMGVDGIGDPDHIEDAQRDEPLQEERSPVSSRRSSLAASDTDDDDDLISNDPIDDINDDIDDDLGDEDAAEDLNDAASVEAPESDRGEPEPVAEETGGGDDDEMRRGE